MCRLLSRRVCGEVWTSWELLGLERALILALEGVDLLHFTDGEIKVQRMTLQQWCRKLVAEPGATAVTCAASLPLCFTSHLPHPGPLTMPLGWLHGRQPCLQGSFLSW